MSERITKNRYFRNTVTNEPVLETITWVLGGTPPIDENDPNLVSIGEVRQDSQGNPYDKWHPVEVSSPLVLTEAIHTTEKMMIPNGSGVLVEREVRTAVYAPGDFDYYNAPIPEGLEQLTKEEYDILALDKDTPNPVETMGAIKKMLKGK